MILTVKEVAQKYFEGKMSVSTIYGLVRKNEIPYLQISSRKIYFDTTALDKWIERMAFQPVPEVPEYGKLRQLR